MKINGKKIKGKTYNKLRDYLEFYKDEKQLTLTTGENEFLIIIDNIKAVKTIENYFNTNITFKDDNNKLYILCEGNQKDDNVYDKAFETFDIDDSKAYFFDLTTFFNYGTGFFYSVVNNNTSIDVNKIELLNTGKFTYQYPKQFKCNRIKKDTILNYFETDLVKQKGLFNDDIETQKQILLNLTWYLLTGEDKHINAVKKVINNIIKTNNINITLKDAMKLELKKEEEELFYSFIDKKLEAAENSKNINVKELEKMKNVKCYSLLLKLYKEKEKEIVAFFENIPADKLHWSGLFKNKKENEWIPIYSKEKLNKIFEDLFFCKLNIDELPDDETIYLIKENKFIIDENLIWQEMINEVSKKYQVELLNDVRTNLLDRLSNLTTEEKLQPCYRVNDIAILDGGENEKFDKTKHLPFVYIKDYKKPTKQDFKNSEKLLDMYVDEPNKKKLKTMLSYTLIPGSAGKKLFFIYSEQSHSGKTTFLENFTKGLYKTNANELINLGSNGQIDKMNELITVEGEFHQYSKSLSKIIKKKTGEKVLNVKQMYQDRKTVYNFNKYISTTNKLPNLRSETALFDKIWIINFGGKELKLNSKFFKENKHLMKSLQQVIIYETLTRKTEIIEELLENRNDKDNDLLLAESNLLFRYCIENKVETDNIYLKRVESWIFDSKMKVNLEKSYCKELLRALELQGKKTDFNKFWNEDAPPEPIKKIDTSQFSVSKTKNK